MGTKESRHAALRDRAIKIAFDILQSEGEEAVQARRIAVASDCSVGTLYNVFESLDGLWLAVNDLTLEALHGELDQAIDTLADATPQELAKAKAVRACEVLLRFAHTNPAQWRSIEHGPVTSGTEPGSALRAHSVTKRVRAMILEAQSTVDAGTAQPTADAVMAMIEGLASRIAAKRGAAIEADQTPVVLAVAVRRMLAA